ncbi:hypothetical protein PED39_07400 [Methanomassiliicoccales archaeon LGM-RCC1]|nr:hypothetical protein PED39_07400 [Methanomassiliicoccales archaeon LGM-RCC1]
MNRFFNEMKDKKTKKKEEPCSIIRDSLIIDCSKCELVPEAGSNECFRCMVDRMSRYGSADRIILRTGRDLEVSGRSSAVIKNISSLKRWTTSGEMMDRACRKCSQNRLAVMNVVWKDFPCMEFTKAKQMLTLSDADDKCSRCMRASVAAIEQLEEDMHAITRRMR